MLQRHLENMFLKKSQAPAAVFKRWCWMPPSCQRKLAVLPPIKRPAPQSQVAEFCLPPPCTRSRVPLGLPWVSRRRGQGDTCLKRGTSTAFTSISSSALTQAGGCAWAERRASPGPHRAQPAPSVTGRGTVLQRGAQTSRYEAQRGRCGRQACAARLSCCGVWEEQNFCSPFL